MWGDIGGAAGGAGGCGGAGAGGCGGAGCGGAGGVAGPGAAAQPHLLFLFARVLGELQPLVSPQYLIHLEKCLHVHLVQSSKS